MIRNNVCAVVVTFNPKIKDLKLNIQSISSQVKTVFILDNSVQKVDFPAFPKNVFITKFGKNLGIAEALNIGIKKAIQNSAEYIITFDQDSRPDLDFISSLLKVINFKEKKLVIVPTIYDVEDSNKHFSSDVEIETAITSGMLIHSSVFPEAGMMKSKLFIDYVDHDFCLRVRRFGFKIIQSVNARLYHSLGSIKVFNFFGKTFYPTNHPPLRRYFITRNRIYLWFIHFFYFPKWVIKDIKNSLVELFLIILAEEKKLKKIYAIFLAIFHLITFQFPKNIKF